MNCFICGEPFDADSLNCPHCGSVIANAMPDTVSPLPPGDPLIGQVLDNKYELVKLLGRGGMGSVYRARRLHFGGTDVAIKILHQHIMDTATRERFKREATAAARLSHPNIVNIYDFEEGKNEQSRAYIVMELLEGTPLNEILDHQNKLDPQRAISLIRAVCDGVNFAHSQGVVHRDLKPHNIVVLPEASGRRSEIVKIVDFGLAKLRPTEVISPAVSITPLGTMLGTPVYMSPEACRGEELDARSDIYSLGATIYHMLAGRPPFVATSIWEVQRKHLHEKPPPLSEDGPELRALQVVIMRALEKDPDKRQQNAFIFAEELHQALQSPFARSPVSESSLQEFPFRFGRAIDPVKSRDNMLSKVRRIWIDGALKNMRALAGPLKIGIHAGEDHRIAKAEPTSTRSSGSTETEVLDLFDDADHQLLILGEPGAGKTFKLLELLDSLLSRAEGNSSVPIPVVFNLSSWASRPEPIGEWLISELVSVYGLPHKLARNWVDGEKLALFLDGLDEITAAGAEPGSDQEEDAQRLTVNYRRKCLEELNDYLAGTNIWLVLCCREKEYLALERKLHTRRENATIMILPLTDQEVEAYLSSAGPEFASLRQALVEDNMLRNLARAPFLLTTMAIAYQHANARSIIDGGKGGLRARLNDMFAKYVWARYHRTESVHAHKYKLKAIRHYLGEWAQKMEEGESKILLVDQLQPDWLPPSGLWLYRLFVSLLLVVFVWVLIGLPSGWAIGYERADSPLIVARLWHFNVTSMILMTLFCGGIISLGFLFSKSWGFGVAWGLNLGVARAIIIGMDPENGLKLGDVIPSALDNSDSWFFQGLVSLVLGVPVLGLLMKVRRHARDRIYPFEGRRWDIRRMLFGLLVGVIVGLVFLAVFDLLRSLAFGIGLALILTLAFGYRNTELEIKTYPNQGIWHSALTALKTAIVAALTGLICFGLTYGSFRNQHEGVVNGILGLSMAVTSLLFGGMPLMQHLGLRLALARCGLAPLNLVGFLNAASNLRLLRRVGGGYMFQHEYLRTYFLEQLASSRQNQP